MLEKDLQRSVIDYLEAMNIDYLRLNSGDVFRPGKDKMYRVKGCPKGTPDIEILSCRETREGNAVFVEPRPIFVELKSTNGKQTPEQKAFEERVKHQGFEYYVVRDLDEMIGILK